MMGSVPTPSQLARDYHQAHPRKAPSSLDVTEREGERFKSPPLSWGVLQRSSLSPMHCNVSVTKAEEQAAGWEVQAGKVGLS